MISILDDESQWGDDPQQEWGDSFDDVRAAADLWLARNDPFYIDSSKATRGKPNYSNQPAILSGDSLTVRAFAEQIGKSRTSVHRLIKKGRIISVVRYGIISIPKSELTKIQ
jgi:hypothetical protein